LKSYLEFPRASFISSSSTVTLTKAF